MAGGSSPLDGRRVVLGVSGSVSAWKSADLCRELGRRGARVSPVLTAAARRFIGEATFDAIADERARTDLWDAPEPSPHTDLARRADLVLVAPASADLLAALRAGLAHDLLTATLLATRAPVVVAPAMHEEMWEHPATRDNLATLAARGVHVVDPARGELAGGDVGVGRLADLDTIVAACEDVLAGTARARMDGLHVLVTAGGTREPIDPVRYLGNRSSGRQGHAIAAAARDRGARVTLVSTTPVPAAVARGVEVIRVERAQELLDAVLAHAADADVVVKAAAVADFRPLDPAHRKIRREDGIPSIELERTPDVLATLVDEDVPGRTLVGFAAETGDMVAGGRRKLDAKGLDLLVANDVLQPGAGFEHATNEVAILGASGLVDEVPMTSKRAVAERILDAVLAERAGTADGEAG